MPGAVPAAPGRLLTVWYHMVPSGAMSAKRRPRIPDELSAAIDKARGKWPFELFVREALWQHLEIFHSHNKENPHRGSTWEATLLTNLLFSEAFQLDLKMWDAAVAEAREACERELYQQAIEDGHSDPDVI